MKIEMIPIGAIKEYDRNPRNNDDAVGPVGESIKAFGFKVPVIVDGENVLVAGHTRVKAARQLGMTEVPAVRADDLTPEQIRAFRIADNKLHELASWDLEMLPSELAELQALDVDLSVLGFGQDELATLLGGVKPGLTDPDSIPAPPDEATTKRGDLWILGEHRVLCGDSAIAEDVNRLLAVNVSFDGTSNATELLPIHLVNTDPPYNVKVEPRSNNAIAAGLSSFGEHGLTHHQSFDLHRMQKPAKTRAELTKLATQLGLDPEEARNIDVVAGLVYDGITQLLIRTVKGSTSAGDRVVGLLQILFKALDGDERRITLSGPGDLQSALSSVSTVLGFRSGAPTPHSDDAALSNPEPGEP